MERDNTVNHVINEIAERLSKKLGELGYQLAIEKDENLLLGSYFFIWSNNEEMIRLTWDGNESNFVVSLSTDLPLNSKSLWVELSATPFDPANENTLYKIDILKKILNTLS